MLVSRAEPEELAEHQVSWAAADWSEEKAKMELGEKYAKPVNTIRQVTCYISI